MPVLATGVPKRPLQKGANWFNSTSQTNTSFPHCVHLLASYFKVILDLPRLFPNIDVFDRKSCNCQAYKRTIGTYCYVKTQRISWRSYLMLSLVTWCLMAYFRFILSNWELFIASCLSTHTLLNGLIRYLTELFSPDRGLNFTVNCVKKCSPLTKNTNTVEINVGILPEFWAS